MINAPTGSGKSTIAAMLPKLDPRRRYVTLTGTKGLQDAYGRTFDHLVDLRGMSNYPCIAAKDQFRDWFSLRRQVMCDDGPCREGASCSLKADGCQYFDARRAFVAAPAGLTNYSAYFANRRFGDGLGQPQVIVCDEAHTLPEQLMSANRIEIPASMLDARPPTSRGGWRQWASEKLEDLTPGSDDDTRARRARTVESLTSLAKMGKRWQWDHDGDRFVFEPTVPRDLLSLLFTDDGSTTVVYLSATIMPGMLDLLGVDDGDVEYLSIPSTFDVRKRPVYLRPVARVDYRSLQHPETLDRLVNESERLIRAREDRNGLIHTVSFQLGYMLYETLRARGLRTRFVMHHRGRPVAKAVEEFRYWGEREPTLLISPSIGEGYDFAMQQAEYQIIAKLPFPNTTSAIERARCKATPGYRDSVTMRRLVQMIGRIVRSRRDQGETFILDAHATWFLREHGDLMAPWCKDAIVTTRRAIRPLPKLREVA